MSRYSIQSLNPGDPPLSVQLGFLARSAIIDNYTSNYVYLSDAGRVIPPYQFGVVIPLDRPQVGSAALIRPPQPLTTYPPIANNNAVITFSERELAPNTGTPTPPPLPVSRVNQGNIRGSGPMSFHVNGAVIPATPYKLARVSFGVGTDSTNFHLLIWSWSLSFDNIVDGGVGSSCFASMVGTNLTINNSVAGNGPEIWNTRLSLAGAIDTEHTRSEVSFTNPLIAFGASNTNLLASDFQFESPLAGSSYNVRGSIVIEVIPVQ